jgi:replicative DNA helicase
MADAMEIHGAALAEEPDVATRFVQKAIALQSKRGGRIRKVHDIAHTVRDRMADYQKGRPRIGIPFGIGHLDRVTRGILPGEFTLIGGRPSEGKTVLLTQLAVNAAVAGIPTLMFSQEMTAEDIVERAVLMRARVDGEKARDGKLEDRDWDRINDRTNELYETPWWISDLPATITEIVARTKQHILEHKVGLVLVDYLQIVQCPGRYENRNIQIQSITEQLQALALAHNIPVVAATQLSRAASKRANPEPVLEDLREGGNQEAAAYKAILIYNPCREECDEQLGDPSCLARLIVAKNKNGKIGKCTVRWIPGWTRFEDTEEEWVPPAAKPERKSAGWKEF